MHKGVFHPPDHWAVIDPIFIKTFLKEHKTWWNWHLAFLSCNGSAETVNLKTEETQIENKNLDVEEGEVKQTSEEIENVSEEFLKELDEN